ncbi:MAG: YcnI family protein [Nocardia sp.]|nr:YcnI family protein [Nocardia sp.]
MALSAAGVASAHVTADAPGAAQGGTAIVTFRVPTESATATTTKLTVTLPPALASARTEAMPGWSAAVQTNDQHQPTAVTWTADPGNPGIGAEQFQRFVLAVGPLPKQDTVSFPAAQTYSDGNVVNWDQPMGADGAEPEHPAPMVTLAAAGAGGEHGAMAATAEHPAATSANSDNTARWLGGIGLVLGALGAALGLGSVLRRRR